MSDTPNKLVDIHQRQPDCGGNRHYDYISLEDFDAAEITLKNKKTWQSLTTNEIVVLRSKAKKLGINQDIVDHSDRLDLLWCLFSHCENRDFWFKRANMKPTPGVKEE